MHHADRERATTRTEAPAAFFAALRDTWSSAADRAGGAAIRSYHVGDAALHIRAAGPALLPHLTRALAHLSGGVPGGGGLTVYAWDDESTGSSTPIEPWLRSRNGDPGFRASSGDLLVVTEEGRLEAIDLVRGEALFWVDSPARIPWYDSAVPLQTILQPWIADRGLRFLHAGAVGRPDGCLLVVGKSGAGKSTTALACLESPLRYLADDFCLVRSDDMTVFSVYSSAKTTDDTAARLPHLAPMLTRPGPPDEKWVAFLHEHVPDRLLERAPLRGIVVPRVTGRRESVLVPAGRAGALAELTPSSLRDQRQFREDGFRRLAAVAAAVPSHILELGTDIAGIPPLLAQLLDA